MSEQKVIDAILKIAQGKVDSIKEKSAMLLKEQSAKIIADADLVASELLQSANEFEKSKSAAFERSAKLNADVYLQAQKVTLLDVVEQKLLKKLYDINDKERIKLYENLFTKYCPTSGRVEVLANKNFSINKAFIDSLAKVTKGIELISTTSDIDDGIIISGETYDIDLTYKNLASSILHEYEFEAYRLIDNV